MSLAVSALTLRLAHRPTKAKASSMSAGHCALSATTAHSRIVRPPAMKATPSPEASSAATVDAGTLTTSRFVLEEGEDLAAHGERLVVERSAKRHPGPGQERRQPERRRPQRHASDPRPESLAAAGTVAKRGSESSATARPSSVLLSDTRPPRGCRRPAPRSRGRARSSGTSSPLVQRVTARRRWAVRPAACWGRGLMVSPSCRGRAPRRPGSRSAAKSARRRRAGRLDPHGPAGPGRCGPDHGEAARTKCSSGQRRWVCVTAC